jgi:hypothetical protein
MKSATLLAIGASLLSRTGTIIAAFLSGTMRACLRVPVSLGTVSAYGALHENLDAVPV